MAKKNKGNQPQEYVLKREPGKNLPDLVSRLISSGTIPTFLQFVANSFDADATKVHIQYRSEERLLSITDDGEGMGLQELSAFLVGIQENENYSVFYRYKNKIYRIILGIDSRKINIVTFYFIDERQVPKI